MSDKPESLKAEVYGIDMELPVPVRGHVTDVVVIARSVWFTPDGMGQDSLLMAVAPTTTNMVRRAMVSTANEFIEDCYRFGEVEDDED